MENMDLNTYQEMRRMQQLEQAKRALMGQILTKEAFERLSRVRIANPQLAAQVELYLLQIHQTGKLKGIRITDEKLRAILKTLTYDNHSVNIRRI